MDDRPKIIIKLEKLYLVLSWIFFSESILIIIWLIVANAFSVIFDPSADRELVFGCLTIFLGISIISFLFGLFSLKISRSIKMREKLVIADGIAFSIISLFIFLGPTIYLLSSLINAQVPPTSLSLGILLFIFILVFLLLIVLLDVIIIATSITKQVSAYCKAPVNIK